MEYDGGAGDYNYLDDLQDDQQNAAAWRLARSSSRDQKIFRRQWLRASARPSTPSWMKSATALSQQHRPGCPLQCLWRIAGRGVQPAGGFLYLLDAQYGPRVGRVHLFDDAYDDLKKDARHGSFNALAATKQAFAATAPGLKRAATLCT